MHRLNLNKEGPMQKAITAHMSRKLILLSWVFIGALVFSRQCAADEAIELEASKARADSILSGNRVEAIRNVIIFGNHSSTQFPDIAHVRIQGTQQDARELVGRDWYERVFIRTIQMRGAAVIAARKLSSACSAAKAIADHLDSWLNGTPLGEYCSMAVSSADGGYGCPPDLFFSYPVTCHNASWTIVTDLELDEFSQN